MDNGKQIIAKLKMLRSRAGKDDNKLVQLFIGTSSYAQETIFHNRTLLNLMMMIKIRAKSTILELVQMKQA